MSTFVSHVGKFLFPPIPTPEKETEEKEAKSLKEKVKANWREIPAIVAVAVCVIGLILSIAWNYTHLSIVFGAGIGCSGFTYFYLSHQVHHLKSMKVYLGDFNKENHELRVTSDTIQKQAVTLQEENLTLKGSVGQLQQLYTILNEFYKKFHQEGTASQQQFQTNLVQLSESLTKLQEEQNSAAQSAALLKTILTNLSETLQFESLSKMWKEYQKLSEDNKKMLEEKAKVQFEAVKLHSEVGKLESEVGKLEEQRKEFQGYVDQLKPVVRELLPTLRAENTRLAANTDKVEEAAEIIQKAINLFSLFLSKTQLTGVQSPFPVQKGREVEVR